MASQTQDDEAKEELQSAEDEEYEFDHGDCVGVLGTEKIVEAGCFFMS